MLRWPEGTQVGEGGLHWKQRGVGRRQSLLLHLGNRHGVEMAPNLLPMRVRVKVRVKVRVRVRVRVRVVEELRLEERVLIIVS